MITMFGTLVLQSEDIFLIMFESEYQEMKKKPLNVERLMMDSVILLPPTGTPMTGIEFTKRLPCGEVSIDRSIFCANVLYCSSNNYSLHRVW